MAAAAAARTGASDVAFAKHNALETVSAAQAQGFDVDETLTVTDRMTGLSPVLLAHRQSQAQAHAASIRAAAAELLVVDEQVAARITSAMTGLDVHFAEAPLPSPDDEIIDGRKTAIQSVDFKQDGGDNEPRHDFGGCFSENFRQDIGENMVQGVFVGGALGAIRGGVVGILGGPLGVLGGGVVGFVGGAAGGALISGPARTAATSAWDCL